MSLIMIIIIQEEWRVFALLGKRKLQLGRSFSGEYSEVLPNLDDASSLLRCCRRKERLGGESVLLGGLEEALA